MPASGSGTSSSRSTSGPPVSCRTIARTDESLRVPDGLTMKRNRDLVGRLEALEAQNGANGNGRAASVTSVNGVAANGAGKRAGAKGRKSAKKG